MILPILTVLRFNKSQFRQTCPPPLPQPHNNPQPDALTYLLPPPNRIPSLPCRGAPRGYPGRPSRPNNPTPLPPVTLDPDRDPTPGTEGPLTLRPLEEPAPAKAGGRAGGPTPGQPAACASPKNRARKPLTPMTIVLNCPQFELLFSNTRRNQKPREAPETRPQGLNSPAHPKGPRAGPRFKPEA